MEETLNDQQIAVLVILDAHGGRSGMEAQAIGERLITYGVIEAAWGRIGTQAGGRGQKLARASSGPTKATRSAQRTLRKLVKDQYVTASVDQVKRYKITDAGRAALPE
jgi:hypothetical protein